MTSKSCDGYDEATGKCRYSGGHFGDKAYHDGNKAHADWVTKNKAPASIDTKGNKLLLCPRCKLPTLSSDPAMNSMSLDGKEHICADCGQIETLKTTDPLRAQLLIVAQERLQAATYGLDKKRRPRLPKEM